MIGFGARPEHDLMAAISRTWHNHADIPWPLSQSKLTNCIIQCWIAAKWLINSVCSTLPKKMPKRWLRTTVFGHFFLARLMVKPINFKVCLQDSQIKMELKLKIEYVPDWSMTYTDQMHQQAVEPIISAVKRQNIREFSFLFFVVRWTF